MDVSTEKYLGEAPLKDVPKKKFRFLIGEKAVKTKHIDDQAVTTEKIHDSAVTTEKINNSAVTTEKINNSAVTTEKINDSAVTTEKINNNAVTTEKIDDCAVTKPKLGQDVIDWVNNLVDTLRAWAQQHFDAIYQSITALTGRLDVAEQEIDVLQEDVDTLETRMDSVESRTTTNENDIDSLEERAVTAEENIATLTSGLEDATTRLADTEERIGDIEQIVGSGSGESSLPSRIEALEENISEKANSSDVYTKEEVEEKIATSVVSDKTHIVLTQEEYDALTEKDASTIYLIVSNAWTFGEQFPVVLE